MAEHSSQILTLPYVLNCKGFLVILSLNMCRHLNGLHRNLMNIHPLFLASSLVSVSKSMP